MTTKPIQAMAFYNSKGYVAAYDTAMAFAGEGGRIASLPDILEARIANPEGAMEWNGYYTTSSSEFYGFTRAGVPVIAVLHGTGPLSTKAGVLEAYSAEIKDKTSEIKGGRVPRDLFLEIVDGRHGAVLVADLEPVLETAAFPFQALSAEEILASPLWIARLGGEKLAHRYLEAQWGIAEADAETRFAKPGKPLRMEEISNGDGSYTRPEGRSLDDLHHVPRELAPDEARGSLLGISGLANVHVSGKVDLQCDVGPVTWREGHRLVGIRRTAAVGASIDRGLDRRSSLAAMTATAERMPDRPVRDPARRDSMVQIEGQHFVCYPKEGDALDSGEAMHRVVHMVQISEAPVALVRDNCTFSYTYPVDDLYRLAPPGANAHLRVGSPSPVGGGRCSADFLFYRVEVDRSLRYRRADEIEKSYDLIAAAVEASGRPITATS